MKLLACLFVLQSALVVSIKLGEVEKLLKDDTQKLKTLEEPKNDENYEDKDEEELLEELEDFKILIDGLCAEEVARLSKSGSSRRLVGHYVPQCSGDGGYKPEQCHTLTGYCWCVNIRTGEEIQGTRTRGPLICGGRALSAGDSRRQGLPVGVGGHYRRLSWPPPIHGEWGKDMQQIKPSAENGWSVSASVGSDQDAKQTKPSSSNRWSVSGSISSGRDAKQNKPSAKNKWSVSASVGSGKDAKQAKHAAANGWKILCNKMTMKKLRD